MDPEKHRHPLALGRDDSVSAFSALRASTRSPSFRRLSLRKSRSSSCSTTDSISVHSTESRISPRSSCVTRDTPRDECAFHRFMVWVAVKRNECERMTPSERLECPLLRCRKRFANHERMLRHLYTCDELDSGEYWCYDCERPERFTDAKCKRCLGHPTKRRKILSMAKNFFTSLGHKPRKDGLLGQLPEDDALVPPPSYDSLNLGLNTNELCSAGEIHEIDSTEVRTNPPPAPVPAPPPPMQNPAPRREPDAALFLSSTLRQPPPPCVFPAELDTRISPAGPHENPVASWINDPMAYFPLEDPGRRNSTEERRSKTRSKTLAPSSSLRSNASNSSTNTTNSSTSTNSTDSTNTMSTGISPSIWSEPWTVASGMDTELEPPISSLLYPSKFDGKDVSMGLCDSAFDGDVFMQDFGISELPADLPLLAPLPATSDHFADPQNLLPLGNPTDKVPGPDMTMLGNVDDLIPDVTNIAPDVSAEASPSSNPQSPFTSSVEPSSLVTSIWETLQAHIFSSEAKLRPMGNNSLAAQFLAMDSRSIASYGHATLKKMLQGRPPESPLHLLCYVHVAYAYFLVVHQEDAGVHSKQLFAQALNYASGSGMPSQIEYLEIARVIWEPDDVREMISTKAGGLQFELGGSPSSMMSPAMVKGKGPSKGGPVRDDVLLTVAQYLLDEFEYSILSSDTPHPREILSSDLCAAHAMGDSLVSAGNAFPGLWNAIGSIVNLIVQRFGSYRGLTSAIELVNQRVSKGYIPTARRTELELLQAGHGCVSLTTFINEYAPFVRQQCDILYSNQTDGMAWGCTHYGQAVDLVESILPTSVPARNVGKSPNTSDLDEFLILPTPPFIDSDFGLSPACTTPWDSLSPGNNTATASSNGVSITSTSSGHPSPHGDDRNPDSTIPQMGPSDTESRPAAQKVEANACCELCGYRPKGAPQWFKGSMSKHMKNKHSADPPTIYKCGYPGCTSQYKNRQDNLRQHQFEKGHFVDGEIPSKRPSKRKRT